MRSWRPWPHISRPARCFSIWKRAALPARLVFLAGVVWHERSAGGRSAFCPQLCRGASPAGNAVADRRRATRAGHVQRQELRLADGARSQHAASTWSATPGTHGATSRIARRRTRARPRRNCCTATCCTTRGGAGSGCCPIASCRRSSGTSAAACATTICRGRAGAGGLSRVRAQRCRADRFARSCSTMRSTW